MNAVIGERHRIGCSICLAVAFSAVLSSAVAHAQKAPQGFQIDLIYAAPDIVQPSVVTCDDQGNLFVGEDPMDMGPSREEIDRVVLIRWDKATGKPIKTVFCDHLSAVFGLIWHEGALYVMHAPHYSMFKDTNGDGVADVRKDLADGFGPSPGRYGFNDHIVTGTRLGLDGRVYVSVGDKGIPKATGSDGSTLTLEGGGVVSMKLDGSDLRHFSSGTRNHLDVAMDWLDNIFTYDNTDDGRGWNTRFTHHVPTGYYGYPYDYHPHPDRHLPCISEHGGGSPVGAACYREAAWPEKYRGNAFHCEWGKSKVQRFTLTRQGGTFSAKVDDFLMPLPNAIFNPLDLCFSPDGRTMYVADWNYGGWMRKDLVTGRLFRVTYVGGDVPAEPSRTNDRDPLDAQIKSLGHPAHSERMRAQFQLARMGTAAVAPVTAVLSGETQAAAKVHAIWTLNLLADRVSGYNPSAAWIKALSDQDPDVRGQAARALGERKIASAVGPLIAALKDSDPGVRLRSAVALGRIGDHQSAGPLFDALGETDQFARFTMIQALRAINDWTPAQKNLASQSKDVRTATLVALTGVYEDAAVAAVVWAVEHGADAEFRAKAVEALAEVHHKADPYTDGWWGTGPATGKPARPKKHDWSGTPLVLRTLGAALRSADPPVRLAAVRAAREGNNAALLAVTRAIALDAKETELMRAEAIQTLIAQGPQAAAEPLASLAAQPALPDAVVQVVLRGVAMHAVQPVLPLTERSLNSPNAAVRQAAIVAYARLLGPKSAARIGKALGDPHLSVREAAVDALAELGDRDSVPALAALSADLSLREKTMAALAKTPDRRALAALLSGIVDPNFSVRQSAKKAISELGNDVQPELAELHKRRELSAAVRRELQSVLAKATPIAAWQIVGPWPKASPPTIKTDGAPNLAQPIAIGGMQVPWKRVPGAKSDGHVSLEAQIQPNFNVWTMAYAAVESRHAGPASLTIGSDDQLILWVNGVKVYEFLSDRGWSPSDTAQCELRQGVNHFWAQSGNGGASWGFSVAVHGRAPGWDFLYEAVPARLEPAEFSNYAASHVGDPARGRTIFANPNGVGCVKCHAVGGEGGKIGPDLLGIGSRYPREELIRSVLEPSNRVLSGYQVTTIVTDDGKVQQGIVKSDTQQEVELIDVQGKSIRIPVAQIDERATSALSLMPNGLADGLTLEGFADVVAYLESLKENSPPK